MGFASTPCSLSLGQLLYNEEGADTEVLLTTDPKAWSQIMAVAVAVAVAKGRMGSMTKGDVKSAKCYRVFYHEIGFFCY